MYSFFNKNSSADVISSLLAGRLSGTRPISLSHSSAETISDWRTKPGAMALTRTFGASARARILVRDSNAALLTVYDGYLLHVFCAPTSVMLTISPPLFIFLAHS